METSVRVSSRRSSTTTAAAVASVNKLQLPCPKSPKATQHTRRGGRRPGAATTITTKDDTTSSTSDDKKARKKSADLCKELSRVRRNHHKSRASSLKSKPELERNHSSETLSALLDRDTFVPFSDKNGDQKKNDNFDDSFQSISVHSLPNMNWAVNSSSSSLNKNDDDSDDESMENPFDNNVLSVSKNARSNNNSATSKSLHDSQNSFENEDSKQFQDEADAASVDDDALFLQETGNLHRSFSWKRSNDVFGESSGSDDMSFDPKELEKRNDKDGDEQDDDDDDDDDDAGGGGDEAFEQFDGHSSAYFSDAKAVASPILKPHSSFNSSESPISVMVTGETDFKPFEDKEAEPGKLNKNSFAVILANAIQKRQLVAMSPGGQVMMRAVAPSSSPRRNRSHDCNFVDTCESEISDELIARACMMHSSVNDPTSTTSSRSRSKSANKSRSRSKSRSKSTPKKRSDEDNEDKKEVLKTPKSTKTKRKSLKLSSVEAADAIKTPTPTTRRKSLSKLKNNDDSFSSAPGTPDTTVSSTTPTKGKTKIKIRRKKSGNADDLVIDEDLARKLIARHLKQTDSGDSLDSLMANASPTSKKKTKKSPEAAEEQALGVDKTTPTSTKKKKAVKVAAAATDDDVIDKKSSSKKKALRRSQSESSRSLSGKLSKMKLAEEMDSEISSTQLSSATSGNNDEETPCVSARKNKKNTIAKNSANLKVVPDSSKKKSFPSSEEPETCSQVTRLKSATASQRGSIKAEDLERIDLKAMVKAASKKSGSTAGAMSSSSDDDEEALIQNLVRKVLALNNTIQGDEEDGKKSKSSSALSSDKKNDKDDNKKKSKKERDTSLKSETSQDGNKRSKSRSKSRAKC